MKLLQVARKLLTYRFD